MKGIVFNLLAEVVGREFSDDIWDDLLDAAGLDGAFTSLGNYPDGDMEALVAAASGKLGLSRPEVLRWFGRNAISVLAKHYPSFFEPHTSSRPFVLGVNNVIHTEVRKLYPGAMCPHFDLRPLESDSLAMTYHSERRMCGLAQGFVEGAAAHYGEEIEFHHEQCVDHDDPHCTFRITWPPVAAP